MTSVAVGVRLEPQTRLRLYATLLQMTAADFGDALQNEAERNPWLHIEPPTAAGRAENDRPLVADKPSLTDHLERQILARSLPSSLRRAALAVVADIDERGFLRDAASEIARSVGLSVDTVVRAERLVARLEPAGLATRTLGDRLRVQLEVDGSGNEATDAVTSDLERLAAEGPAAFAERTGFARAEIDDAIERLRGLDRDPLAAFAAVPHYVIPELRFDVEDGRVNVCIVRERWPRLCFVPLLTGRVGSSELRDARARARAYIDAIERRATTLQRLGDVLGERQSAYFRSGGDASALEPLSGREIAREIGCSESTVSRALATRYAETSFGTVALRSLIVRRPGSIAMSTALVRETVSGLFGSVPGLSDAAAARLLRLRGINLARRTVAKYRSEAGFASLVDRGR